jgi:hypothetical protein
VNKEMEAMQRQVSDDWMCYTLVPDTCTGDPVPCDTLLRANFHVPYITFAMSEGDVVVIMANVLLQHVTETATDVLDAFASGVRVYRTLRADAAGNPASATNEKRRGVSAKRLMETRELVANVCREEHCIIMDADDMSPGWPLHAGIADGGKTMTVAVEGRTIRFATQLVSYDDVVSEVNRQVLLLWMLRLNASLRFCKTALENDIPCLLVRLPLKSLTQEHCRIAVQAITSLTSTVSNHVHALLSPEIAEAYARGTIPVNSHSHSQRR